MTRTLLGAVPVLALGLVITRAAAAAPAGAAELVPAPAGWQAGAFPACLEERCRFTGRSSDEIYLLDDGHLVRTSGGAELFRREVLERLERLLAAGLSPAGNQLVLAVVREKVTRNRSLVSGGGAHPGDVAREHRLAVVNPKSGETVKSIDLGAFRPSGLAISEHGERVLVAGRDLDLGRESVRVYNTRSGKLEIEREVDDEDAVVLAADGVAIAGRGWVVAAGDDGVERRFNSRDPYSIAEYQVGCASRLASADLAGQTLAVVGFTGADSAVNPMLTSALALKLRDAGFAMAERERIETLLDEIYLQTTGATSDEKAVQIGRLANVQALVFGSLAEAESTSALTVRVVGVEEGTVIAGCEVTCRDCRRDDYLEALGFLVEAWVVGTRPP